MSLDFSLTRVEPTEVFSANITHNLGEMAAKAGIYEILWHPERAGVKTAADVIPALRKGIANMEDRPEYYKKFDSLNGWGKYEHFLPWLKKVLAACEEYPDATVEASI